MNIIAWTCDNDGHQQITTQDSDQRTRRYLVDPRPVDHQTGERIRGAQHVEVWQLDPVRYLGGGLVPACTGIRRWETELGLA